MNHQYGIREYKFLFFPDLASQSDESSRPEPSNVTMTMANSDGVLTLEKTLQG